MKKKIAIIVAFSLFTSNFTAFGAGREAGFTNRIEVFEKVCEIYSGKDFFIRKTDNGYLVKNKHRNEARFVSLDDEASVECIEELISRQNRELNESMLKTLLKGKPVISNMAAYANVNKSVVFEQKHYQPTVNVSVINAPESELKPIQEKTLKIEYKQIQPNIVAVVTPKIEEKRKDEDFDDNLQYLRAKNNEIQVIMTRENRKTGVMPLVVAQSEEPNIADEPEMKVMYSESGLKEPKAFIPQTEPIQVVENNDESVDEIEVEEEDAGRLVRVSDTEPSFNQIVQRDGYYSNSDFEITKIGKKYRVKRKSDNKVFTLRDKNKETIFVKNILAGYNIEDNSNALIWAISGYQKEQDNNRKKRNRRRWKRAGKFVLGAGLVVGAAAVVASAAKSGAGTVPTTGYSTKNTNSENAETMSIVRNTVGQSSTTYLNNNLVARSYWIGDHYYTDYSDGTQIVRYRVGNQIVTRNNTTGEETRTIFTGNMATTTFSDGEYITQKKIGNHIYTDSSDGYSAYTYKAGNHIYTDTNQGLSVHTYKSGNNIYTDTNQGVSAHTYRSGNTIYTDITNP